VQRGAGDGAKEQASYSQRAHDKVAVKFDTACSKNMSGVQGRLQNPTEQGSKVTIQGFNGNQSTVTLVGTNADDKSEYYVQQMPSNLVLLCAHDYAMDGAAILFADDGVVLQLDEEQIAQLRDVISPWAVTKQLVVRNSTYEVSEQGEEMSSHVGYAANTYFNTNINVSNVEERILVYLI
jgi:sulfur transfer complex TusBCD TusB component (DsrH family)